MQKNLKLYESFRYEPWTTKPRHAKGISLHPSELVPGTIGVHLQGSSDFVCNYPGALMWEELHALFSEWAYCPTAVRVPVLDYLVDADTAEVLGLDEETKEGDQFRVRVLLVGDPCAVGPLINSPFGTTHVATCKLETCKPSAILRHLKKLDDGRFLVEADFLAVHRNLSKQADEVELLLDYDSVDSPEFWSTVFREPYCDNCFTRNPSGLIQCSHSSNGIRCPVGRHKSCDVSIESQWYCSRHPRFSPQPHFSAASFLRTPPPPRLQQQASHTQQATPSNLSSRLDNSAQSLSARFPRLAKDRAVAALAQGEFASNPPTHNLPPALGAAPLSGYIPQVYYPAESWRGGLEFNCRALSLTHRRSGLGADAGEGLFEGKPQAPGDLVGYFFGHFIPKQDNMTFVQQGPSYSKLGRIPVEQAVQAQHGVWWSFYAQGVEDSGNEYVCIIDRQCPMGYANDPRDQSRVNCEVRYPKEVLQNEDGSLAYGIFPVYATRHIPATHEVFLSYNWSQADWKLAKSLHTSSSVSPAASESSAANSLRRYIPTSASFLTATPPPPEQPSSPHSHAASATSLAQRFHATATPCIRTTARVFSKAKSDSSADSSSASSSDESSSSSDDCQTRASSFSSVRTSSLTKRTPALREFKAPNFKFSQPLAPLVACTEDGKARARAVWKKCFTIMKERKIRPSRTLSLPEADHGTDHEAKVLRRLVANWSAVVHCCASMDKVLQHAAGLRVDQFAFTSWETLLAARIASAREHGYDMKSVNSHIGATLKASTGFVHWGGLPLCLSCYVHAVGWSRSRAYRSHGSVFVERDSKKHLSAMVTKRVATQLQTMALDQGQFNPTASSDKGSRTFVLPYKTQVQAREQLIQQMRIQDGDSSLSVCEATFRRAIRMLEDMCGIFINMKANKKLAKCAKCTEFLNQLQAARKAKNATAIEEYQSKFAGHNAEWKEQRALFEEKKKLALRQPWMLNVATLDGMDTAKTNLPHYKRLTKHVDTAFTLPIRVVGAFYFGGPVPVMGMTSFEDVPSKGAAASITAIETMINLQYEAMDETNIAPIPTEAEQIQHAAEAMAPLPDDIEVKPEESKQWSESEPKLPKVPFMWPEGLHLTFDNTSGDCKNTGTFRFLGMLVALGVFCYITVSTLLVGHTHDIVDQMFSVWSGQLSSNNAPTLEVLHTLFRNKYSSKIYEIERLKKAAKDGSSAALLSKR